MPGPKYVKDFEFPADAGFHGSAGIQHVRGYARGGKTFKPSKVEKVMREFDAGDLHSGSGDGPKVTKPKQAVAIALSEARRPAKKAKGGALSEDAAQDKGASAKAVHKHEKTLHPGKPMTKLARGGYPAHSARPLITPN